MRVQSGFYFVMHVAMVALGIASGNYLILMAHTTYYLPSLSCGLGDE